MNEAIGDNVTHFSLLATKVESIVLKAFISYRAELYDMKCIFNKTIERF